VRELQRLALSPGRSVLVALIDRSHVPRGVKNSVVLVEGILNITQL
jgi:hypothetical protein